MTFPAVIVRIRVWNLRRELNAYVFRVYWAFLMVNVFLLYAVSGSIFGVLADFIEYLQEPLDLVTLLSDSLPKQAIFFTNYIIMQGFGKTG